MLGIEGIKDTIVAIATSQGASGIGIVRISGKQALKITDRIFLSKDKKRPSRFKTYTVHYGWIINPVSKKKEIIDEVILTVMRSPKSYTKEDVVEINSHGGIVVLRKILELVLASGGCLAKPGEFTKRAFLSGRIDLTQAEAVLDVIQAKTEASLRLSSQQLKGGLSSQINKIGDSLLSVLSFLEASINFPEEEDVEKRDYKQLIKQVKASCDDLSRLLDSASQGRLFREGISVAICGRPNVGKSSLLNTLLKEERVIVTSIPGTTRDTIEETLDIKGIPVRIADTAGIIEPRDLAEKEAVSRAHKYFNTADLILFVFDASKKLTNKDKILINKLNGRPAVAVLNKIDLPGKINKKELKAYFAKMVEISALRHKGINNLEDAIADIVLCGEVIENEGVMITNLRQKDYVSKALTLACEALGLLRDCVSEEFVASTLKSATGYLDQITGKKVDEDLLDNIFSQFCIGK